ncbi:MAG: invasion associated locus B family protein [Reyranellaceae bacterium]
MASRIVSVLVAGTGALAVAWGAGMAQAQQQRPAQQPPAQQAPAQQPAAQPRPATVPQPVPENFEKWTLRCFQDAKGNQACRIETVVREQNNRPQLAVVVRPPAAADQPAVATVTPPWGVLLARGIDLQVDTQPAVRVPIRTCLPTGCLADFSLIESLNNQWQKGTTLKLTMAAADGQSLTIEVPLAGYPKAYARLLEKSKR